MLLESIRYVDLVIPEEKRVSHHDYSLDLNTPFLHD
jgi:hypothetical protein